MILRIWRFLEMIVALLNVLVLKKFKIILH